MVGQNEPVVNLPSLYIDGLDMDAAGNTGFTIGVGQCRDITNTYDIVISEPLSVSATFQGVGGLDGITTLGNNEWYYIYLIVDGRGFNPPAAIMSFNSVNSGGPVMPSGYSSYRRIGARRTNGSAQFILVRQVGTSHERILSYDDPQVAFSGAVGAGGSGANFANLSLDAGLFPPSIDQIYCTLLISYHPVTAANILYIRTYGSTNSTPTGIKGQVDNVVMMLQLNVMASLQPGVGAAVEYNSTSASDVVSIAVDTYYDYL